MNLEFEVFELNIFTNCRSSPSLEGGEGVSAHEVKKVLHCILYLMTADGVGAVVDSEGAVPIVPNVDGNIVSHLVSEGDLHVSCNEGLKLITRQYIHNTLYIQ